MDPRRFFNPQSEWARGTLVAQVFGLGSVRTLEREIEAGRLPFRTTRLGAKGILFVHVGDVQAHRARLLAQQPTGEPA